LQNHSSFFCELKYCKMELRILLFWNMIGYWAPAFWRNCTAFLWNIGNWIVWWCGFMSQQNSIVRLSTVCCHTSRRWFFVSTGVHSSERMTTDTVLVWFCLLPILGSLLCQCESTNVGVLHLGYSCCLSYSIQCTWLYLLTVLLTVEVRYIQLFFARYIVNLNFSLYRQVLFYARDTFLKNNNANQNHTNQTQSSHYKYYISWGLGVWHYCGLYVCYCEWV
jgi:hypothetical protein